MLSKEYIAKRNKVIKSRSVKAFYQFVVDEPETINDKFLYEHVTHPRNKNIPLSDCINTMVDILTQSTEA